MTVRRATLIGACAQAPPAEEEADLWELRGDLNQAILDQVPQGKRLFCLRSSQAGGHFKGTAEQRSKRLLKAAQTCDLVELEAPHDLSPELLAAIAPERRVLAWYGTDAPAQAFAVLAQQPARWYRLELQGKGSQHAMAALRFLKTLGRDDVCCYASGWSGSWTRLVALHLGAPLVFGSAGADWLEPGAFPLMRLRSDYGLPQLAPIEALTGIVGSKVHESRSPLLHNQGYRALKLPYLFVPFQLDDFASFCEVMLGSMGLPSLGLSTPGYVVVAPFKQALVAWASIRDASTQASGGGNVLLREEQGWRACSTDPTAIEVPLARAGREVRDLAAAVVGCGGAGLAAAACLRDAGARVTLVNRSLEKAKRSAETLGLAFCPLERFRAVDFAVVVHATPVGQRGEAPLFSLAGMAAGGLFFEFVVGYGMVETELVRQARDLGLMTFTGVDVLDIQVRRQFQMICGAEMN